MLTEDVLMKEAALKGSSQGLTVAKACRESGHVHCQTFMGRSGFSDGLESQS